MTPGLRGLVLASVLALGGFVGAQELRPSHRRWLDGLASVLDQVELTYVHWITGPSRASLPSGAYLVRWHRQGDLEWRERFHVRSDRFDRFLSLTEGLHEAGDRDLEARGEELLDCFDVDRQPDGIVAAEGGRILTWGWRPDVGKWIGVFDAQSDIYSIRSWFHSSIGMTSSAWLSEYLPSASMASVGSSLQVRLPDRVRAQTFVYDFESESLRRIRIHFDERAFDVPGPAGEDADYELRVHGRPLDFRGSSVPRLVEFPAQRGGLQTCYLVTDVRPAAERPARSLLEYPPLERDDARTLVIDRRRGRPPPPPGAAGRGEEQPVLEAEPAASDLQSEAGGASRSWWWLLLGACAVLVVSPWRGRRRGAV